jgi:UDP-sulfoquinovose synthase
VRCIELALLHPPEAGKRVQIFNQMTETHRVVDLARKVSQLTGAAIQNVDNPRLEAEENELIVQNDGLLQIGLNPIKLDDGLALEVAEIARKYAHRVDRKRIPASSLWR